MTTRWQRQNNKSNSKQGLEKASFFLSLWKKTFRYKPTVMQVCCSFNTWDVAEILFVYMYVYGWNNFNAAWCFKRKVHDIFGWNCMWLVLKWTLKTSIFQTLTLAKTSVIKSSSVNSIFVREVKEKLVRLAYQGKDSSIRNYIPGKVETDILVSPEKKKETRKEKSMSMHISLVWLWQGIHNNVVW